MKDYELNSIEQYILKEYKKIREFYELEVTKNNLIEQKKLIKDIEKILTIAFKKYSKNGILTNVELMKYKRLDKFIITLMNLMRNNIKITKKEFIKSLEMVGYRENLLFDYMLYTLFDINKETKDLQINEILDYFGENTFNRYFDRSMYDSISSIRTEILGITKDSGVDFNKLLDIVKEKIKSFSNRNERIYNNELNRAFNIRDVNRYKELDKLNIKYSKTWLSTLDYKTRDDHIKLDNQKADKDGYFKVNGYKTLAPKLFGVAKEDINCRCTTLAIFDNIKYGERRENIFKKDIINNVSYDTWLKNRGGK